MDDCTATVTREGDLLVLRATFRPGALTPAKALDVAEKFNGLLNAVGADLAPGALRFALSRMEFVDDGKDEVVIRVLRPDAPEGAP